MVHWLSNDIAVKSIFSCFFLNLIFFNRGLEMGFESQGKKAKLFNLSIMLTKDKTSIIFQANDKITEKQLYCQSTSFHLF